MTTNRNMKFSGEFSGGMVSPDVARILVTGGGEKDNKDQIMDNSTLIILALVILTLLVLAVWAAYLLLRFMKSTEWMLGSDDNTRKSQQYEEAKYQMEMAQGTAKVHPGGASGGLAAHKNLIAEAEAAELRKIKKKLKQQAGGRRVLDKKRQGMDKTIMYDEKDKTMAYMRPDLGVDDNDSDAD
jgi:hypothetical protein